MSNRGPENAFWIRHALGNVIERKTHDFGLHHSWGIHYCEASVTNVQVWFDKAESAVGFEFAGRQAHASSGAKLRRKRASYAEVIRAALDLVDTFFCFGERTALTSDVALLPLRHPTWGRSWHRDALFIGIGIWIAAYFVSVLLLKKRGWVRWTVSPMILLVVWIGFRFNYFALGLY